MRAFHQREYCQICDNGRTDLIERKTKTYVSGTRYTQKDHGNVFLHFISSLVAGNFALSFQPNFRVFPCIFEASSGSTELITMIWVSLKICFPPEEHEYFDNR